MNDMVKKTIIVLLAVIFALSMAVPAALSFADSNAVRTMTGLVNATTVAELDAEGNAEDPLGMSAVSSASSASASASSGASTDSSAPVEMGAKITTSASDEPRPGEPSATINSAELIMAEDPDAGDCTATIRYMEYPWEEDPNAPVDEDGRILLGTHEVTGLHEGDVLHAWDYVVDIPGHFFFDGWPLDLKVTNDPAQNVMTLIYVKLWNCEYTVNYYVMEGADLTADNWTDALKPEGVTFTKVASETVGDQIYDTLVKGDAYEYQVDGLYVIDTYPAEIRVGLEPDENVINVLYTTSYATGPDSVEVPSDYAVPDGTPLPDDTTVGKDEIIDILPDGAAPGDEIYDDFVGTVVRPGELVVTDEMLQHPVNKEQATLTAQAYATGLQQNSNLAQTSDQLPWLVGVLVMGAAIVALAIGVVVLSRRSKKAVAED